uniref:Transmembrane protein n=1 Tax=Steinernema glaseri TaxID=37863 RepID=A0A1I7ZD86_9BILA
MVADNVDEALTSVNKLLKEANRTVSGLSSAVSYAPHFTYTFFTLLTLMLIACVLFVLFQYYVGRRLYKRHKSNNTRPAAPENGRLVEEARS